MFCGPRILVWACSLKPPQQLLLRDFHLFASSEHIAPGWLEVRPIHGRRRERTRERASKTSCCSARLSSFSADGEKFLLEGLISEAPLESHYHHPQVSAKTKVAPYLFSTFSDCLIKRTCWPWGPSQPAFGFINKGQCNFLQNCYSVNMPALNPWIVNQLHCQAHPHHHSVDQLRTVHQAARCVSDSWRDCLSSENENRCRRVLQASWKHYEMDKVRKGASQAQGSNKGRWASILVSLCYDEGRPALLFTLRSCTLKGKHKGDVSFAGGKSDPADGDVVATALREAREELGVTVPAERVWGVMKPLRDASGMMIAPVLANLGPLEDLAFKPNPEEVEEIFTLSLSHLCNPRNRGYTNFRTGDKYGYTLPVFRNGKHRVWGLTAVALDQALKLVIPPYGSVTEVFNA